jgi:alpha-tubulin suppressor-like RCC1 family protein
MSNRIDLGKLEFALIEKLNQSLSEFDAAALSIAIRQIRNAKINVVANFSDLPPSNQNVGQIYYVENDQLFYVAFENVWDSSLNPSLGKFEVFTWGSNSFGQLGIGSTTNRSSPDTIAGGTTGWCQVSAGSGLTEVIKTNGTLWTWGNNGGGSLGNGSTTNRSSPGTTAGCGTNWCQVSIASAVKTDGTLWTWGSNGPGRLGDGSTTDRSSPGTTAGGGTNWCQVSGGAHTAAVKQDGTLWTWGCNGCGRLGDGSTTDRSSPGTTAGGGTNWSQVSGGSCHTAAVRTNGTLWTWGSNVCGRLGTGNTTNRSSPGTTAGGGTDWCQVSGGYTHTAAVKQDGTLWTWGNNGTPTVPFGQLGDGSSSTPRCSPGTTAGGGTNWCQVSAGNFHAAAVKTDGTLWTWGYNSSGQLGTGNTTIRSSPGTTAGGGTTWCQVSAGSSFTTVVRVQSREF